MIGEQALRKACRPAVFERARTMVRHQQPIRNRSCRYEGPRTVLSGDVASVSGYEDSYHATISFDEAADEVSDFSCTCPAARKFSGACKHAIALALDFNAHAAGYAGYDSLEHVETSAPLRAYLDQRQAGGWADAAHASTEHEGSVSLELTLAWQRDLFCRFRIHGVQGSYVVKDIGDLADRFEAGAFFEYGKRLAFAHDPKMLDAPSREVLAFLQRAVANRRSFSAERLYGRVWAQSSQRPAAIGRELRLSDPEVDELLGLWMGRTLSFEDPSNDFGRGAERELEVADGDPPLSLEVAPAGDDAYELVRHGKASFFSTARHTYAISGKRLLRCSDALHGQAGFLDGVWSSKAAHVMLGSRDAARFAAALPALEDALKVEAPPQIEELRPRPCRLEFRLDRGRAGVTCDARARYGDRSYPLFAAAAGRGAQGAPDPARDLAAEARGRQLVGRWFATGASGQPHISARSTDQVARLLFEGLDELRAAGDVLTTDSFDRLVHDGVPQVRLGLSVRSQLINLDVSAKDLPLSELYAVLASYRDRKRFHRLRDGSYIDLSKADLSEAACLVDELGITSKQLSSGTVRIEPYKAFLLDNLMSDEEKDASFSSYIDGFRSVDPGSYEPPASLAHVLRGYQVQGFQWMSALCDMGFGGILADEMGLGKSVQLIALVLARRGRGPALIVCPSSLVYNWQAEFEKFAPQLDVAVVAGDSNQRRQTRAERGHEVFITSYDLCRRDVEQWAAIGLWLEVLDEAQYIKNHETLAAKAVKVLHAKHRLALTGTPIENRLSELWSIFDYLMPGLLGSYDRFRERYEEPIMAGDDGAAARLRAAVGPFVLRRLKRDVLADLPDKLEQVVYARLEGEQRRLYDAREQALRVSLTSQDAEEFGRGKLQVLAELTRLRQICCDPRLAYEGYDGPSAKLDAIGELASSVADSQQKMLIFSQFTSYLDLIAARLDEMGLAHYAITGSTPKKRRLELVDAFNADDTPVFLISLKAGGTGLNLTGASVVIHADPWWNAAAQDQATDRAHRIGQTRDVTVYKVIAKDTIEDRILALQERKSELADAVVGEGAGMSLAKLTRDDLIDLLG